MFIAPNLCTHYSNDTLGSLTKTIKSFNQYAVSLLSVSNQVINNVIYLLKQQFHLVFDS